MRASIYYNLVAVRLDGRMRKASETDADSAPTELYPDCMVQLRVCALGSVAKSVQRSTACEIYNGQRNTRLGLGVCEKSNASIRSLAEASLEVNGGSE